MFDPYGTNIFESDPHRDGPAARRPRSKELHAELGMVLEDPASGFVGAVIRVEKSGGMYIVELEDRRGRHRSFPLGGGFWVDGKPVILLPPKQKAPARAGAPALVNSAGRKVTNSGSVAADGPLKPQVARASRIWVEGRHDAELVQHVWGDDLAEYGVTVNLLDGVDHLADILEVFGPDASQRAGVLVDHLVPGSKESRIADAITKQWGSDAVLVVGHPFVDIWQAVKPARVGLDAWPDVPRGTDIKVGSLAALGLPRQTKEDIGLGWKWILSRVRDFRDLEPALLGRVEELIDFVTEPGVR